MRKKVSNGSTKRTKPIKARRRWVINPKTRIVKSERIYKRSKLKEELKKIYGPRTFQI